MGGIDSHVIIGDVLVSVGVRIGIVGLADTLKVGVSSGCDTGESRTGKVKLGPGDLCRIT